MSTGLAELTAISVLLPSLELLNLVQVKICLTIVCTHVLTKCLLSEFLKVVGYKCSQVTLSSEQDLVVGCVYFLYLFMRCKCVLAI